MKKNNTRNGSNSSKNWRTIINPSLDHSSLKTRYDPDENDTSYCENNNICASYDVSQVEECFARLDGIPDSCRGQVWQLMSPFYALKAKEETPDQLYYVCNVVVYTSENARNSKHMGKSDRKRHSQDVSKPRILQQDERRKQTERTVQCVEGLFQLRRITRILPRHEFSRRHAFDVYGPRGTQQFDPQYFSANAFRRNFQFLWLHTVLCWWYREHFGCCLRWCSIIEW